MRRDGSCWLSSFPARGAGRGGAGRWLLSWRKVARRRGGGRFARGAGNVRGRTDQHLNLALVTQPLQQITHLVVGQEADDLRSRLFQADRLFLAAILDANQGVAALHLERADDLAGLGASKRGG